MKKTLALVLTIVMCASCLLTGCQTGNPNGTQPSETGKNTETGSEKEKVDINDLYKKGAYEGVDMSKYLTLGDYTGLITLKESDYTVSAEDIQKEIDGYREAYGTEEEVKDRDVVQKGDIVNINYVGRINGIKFEGGSAEKYDLEIGSGTFIDGFEDGLIGAKKGSTVDVKTTFPKDYKPDPDLAGVEAIFTVTINKISVVVPAEYNDALVSKITNKVYTTVDQFNKYIETGLRLAKKGEVLQKFLEELCKKCTFTEETTKLIDKTYENALKYYEEYAKMYGMTLAKFAEAMGYANEQELKDDIRKDATAEAQNELVMYAYGNAVGFELSNETALAILDNLVILQGSESREAVLTDYGASTVRSECYSEALADVIINNYK